MEFKQVFKFFKFLSEFQSHTFYDRHESYRFGNFQPRLLVAERGKRFLLRLLDNEVLVPCACKLNFDLENRSEFEVTSEKTTPCQSEDSWICLRTPQTERKSHATVPLRNISTFTDIC